MTDWEPLLRRLRDRTGFALGPERMPEVEAAARRAMGRAGVDGLPAWLEWLDSGRAPMTELIDELMVGETYFFREPAQLGLLEEVLPAITTPISLWSAGCASGEEAYSMAILARDLGVADRTRILGTDISRASLEKARSARYGEWSLRGPASLRARAWLTSDSAPRPTYAVDPRIRGAVTFEHLNLVTDPYPSQQDVIFCRNVFIYLRQPVIAEIARRFHGALVDGGWLVLASSDPPLGPPFATVRTDYGIVYRRAPPALRTAPPPPQPVRPPPRRAVAPPAPAAPPRAPPRPPPEPVAAPVADPVARVRALADGGDLAAAERAAAEAHRLSPMRPELHYLHAVLLVELSQGPRAVEALRRVLYLDPASVMAWMTLGTTLRAGGDAAGAKRAFQRVRQLCARLPPGEPIPMADGATATYLGRLAEREESRP
ncbi:MAG: CheR family methyltransferase [Pseudomonadota bacterium]|nr:CheR family methyltransferase [Pseudomonadota bacterium]